MRAAVDFLAWRLMCSLCPTVTALPGPRANAWSSSTDKNPARCPIAAARATVWGQCFMTRGKQSKDKLLRMHADVMRRRRHCAANHRSSRLCCSRLAGFCPTSHRRR